MSKETVVHCICGKALHIEGSRLCADCFGLLKIGRTANTKPISLTTAAPFIIYADNEEDVP